MGGREQRVMDVNVTTHLHIVPSWRMCGAIPLFVLLLHGDFVFLVILIKNLFLLTTLYYLLRVKAIYFESWCPTPPSFTFRQREAPLYLTNTAEVIPSPLCFLPPWFTNEPETPHGVLDIDIYCTLHYIYPLCCVLYCQICTISPTDMQRLKIKIYDSGLQILVLGLNDFVSNLGIKLTLNIASNLFCTHSHIS